MNHIMFGEISAWFYKSLGGIYPDEQNPGFKKVILKPDFAKGLESFEADHTGPYGKIVSSWRKTGKKIEYQVTIPPNSTAELFLKGDKVLESGKKLTENGAVKLAGKTNGLNVINLKAGTYFFTIK